MSELISRQRDRRRLLFFFSVFASLDLRLNIASRRSGRPDRCHQWLCAHDVDDSLQVISEDVQAHLGTDTR
jgi:hypothetical protein